MNRTLTAILLFSLAAFSFAGLAIGRSFENVKFVSSALVTDAGSGTGAATYTYAYKTVEAITVKNTGKCAEGNVLVMRDYSSVPESFSPNATVLLKKTAVWKFASIAPGETVVASAVFPSVLEPSEIASAPVPYFQLEEPRARLEAEENGLLGSRIDIRLVREDGTPVAGEGIVVFSPSGKQTALVTDEAGFASFKPSESGEHYYSVQGYQILNSASTFVKGSAGSPVSASITADQVSPDSLTPLLPVIGAFAIIAVILVGAIFLFGGKQENGDKQILEAGFAHGGDERKPILPILAQGREVVYDDAEKDKLAKAREMTQKIIEMRRQELANQAAQERAAIKETEDAASAELREQYSRRPRRPDKLEQKKPELLKKAGARLRMAGRGRKRE